MISVVVGDDKVNIVFCTVESSNAYTAVLSVLDVDSEVTVVADSIELFIKVTISVSVINNDDGVLSTVDVESDVIMFVDSVEFSIENAVELSIDDSEDCVAIGIVFVELTIEVNELSSVADKDDEISVIFDSAEISIGDVCVLTVWLLIGTAIKSFCFF